MRSDNKSYQEFQLTLFQLLKLETMRTQPSSKLLKMEQLGTEPTPPPLWGAQRKNKTKSSVQMIQAQEIMCWDMRQDMGFQDRIQRHVEPCS